MKNKKLLSVLLAAVGLSVLTGCENSTRAQVNLQLVFPDAEFYAVPKTYYKYIVRDRTGQIYFVEEDGQYRNTNHMTIIRIFNEK